MYGTGGNWGGCAAEKLPVPRAPSVTRASPRALSVPPRGIPKLSSPAPPPFPTSNSESIQTSLPSPGVAKRVNWGNSSPPRLAGAARAAATSSPASERSGPSSEPRASQGSGRVARGSRVAGGGRSATCRPSPSSPLPPGAPRAPGSGHVPRAPRGAGTVGAAALGADTCPSGPPDLRRCSPW